MIPQATAYETDIKVLRDRVNALRTENETLRDQLRCTEAKLATQIERADYAWRNTNVIEKAYQEERAKRDELLAALEKFVAWNKRYPSSRIFSESAIRKIAKELDEIAAESEAAIAKVKP